MTLNTLITLSSIIIVYLIKKKENGVNNVIQEQLHIIIEEIKYDMNNGKDITPNLQEAINIFSHYSSYSFESPITINLSMILCQYIMMRYHSYSSYKESLEQEMKLLDSISSVNLANIGGVFCPLFGVLSMLYTESDQAYDVFYDKAESLLNRCNINHENLTNEPKFFVLLFNDVKELIKKNNPENLISFLNNNEELIECCCKERKDTSCLETLEPIFYMIEVCCHNHNLMTDEYAQTIIKFRKKAINYTLSKMKDGIFFTNHFSNYNVEALNLCNFYQQVGLDNEAYQQAIDNLKNFERLYHKYKNDYKDINKIPVCYKLYYQAIVVCAEKIRKFDVSETYRKKLNELNE